MTDIEREIDHWILTITKLKETQRKLYNQEHTFTNEMKIKRINRQLASAYHRLDKISHGGFNNH